MGGVDADITGPSILAYWCAGSPEPTEFGLSAPASATGIRIMSLNLLLEHEDDP